MRGEERRGEEKKEKEKEKSNNPTLQGGGNELRNIDHTRAVGNA